MQGDRKIHRKERSDIWTATWNYAAHMLDFYIFFVTLSSATVDVWKQFQLKSKI